MWKWLWIVPLALASMAPAANAANPLDMKLTLGTGYEEHPRGLSYDEEAGYLSQSLLLSLNSRPDRSSWRLVYEGYANQFSNGVELDQMQHALGVEWSGSPSDAIALRVGAQVAGRFHSARYDLYDLREAAGFLALRGYPRPGLLWRGHLETRLRSYGELPEESYLETQLQTDVQRFFASRTTIGLLLQWGSKWYFEPDAKTVFESERTPWTSQLRARVNAAQGLNDRLSVRASLLGRIALEEFPHLVREDLYDSPLLDAYARAGAQARASLRALVIWQSWMEIGGSYAEWDFGDLRFYDAAPNQSRRDEVSYAFASLERLFNVSRSARLRAQVQGGWLDQRSNVPTYDYDGWTAWSSLSWMW